MNWYLNIIHQLKRVLKEKQKLQPIITNNKYYCMPLHNIGIPKNYWSQLMNFNKVRYHLKSAPTLYLSISHKPFVYTVLHWQYYKSPGSWSTCIIYFDSTTLPGQQGMGRDPLIIPLWQNDWSKSRHRLSEPFS